MRTHQLLYWETGEILLDACDRLQDITQQAGTFEREACKEAFARELLRLGIPYEQNLSYTGSDDNGDPTNEVMDFVVDDKVLVMVISVPYLMKDNYDSLLDAMHAMKRPVGYLLNAGEPDGPTIHRKYLKEYAPKSKKNPVRKEC